MTTGATLQEFEDILAIMDPFLRDEIRRVYEDKTHRPKSAHVNATHRQAMALRGFCLRYTTFLRNHLDKHQHDDRHHRSQQRLNQAIRVIDEIDAALGLLTDARTLERNRREAVSRATALATTLDLLGTEINTASPHESFTPILELHEAVKRFLGNCMT
jgi:hypothetical protein